jgi:hypothetical protein
MELGPCVLRLCVGLYVFFCFCFQTEKLVWNASCYNLFLHIFYCFPILRTLFLFNKFECGGKYGKFDPATIQTSCGVLTDVSVYYS